MSATLDLNLKIKSPEAVEKIIKLMGIPEDKINDYFIWGDHLCVNLVLDPNGNIVGGRLLPRKDAATWKSEVDRKNCSLTSPTESSSCELGVVLPTGVQIIIGNELCIMNCSLNLNGI